MTRSKLGTYSPFLAIILWGTLLGGIAYSHIVYFPVYLSDLPDSSVIVNGKYALHEGRFWGTIHPLLILSLITTLVLNWKFKLRRKLIASSFGVYILVLICTSLYFVPELMAFAQSPQSNVTAAEWLARGNRWQYLSWARGTICYLSIIPLLVALTKSPDASTETAALE